MAGAVGLPGSGAARVSRERAKGTAWESALVKWLRANGFPHAERRALHGAHDKGDITGIPGLVIEAKHAARVELAHAIFNALN